MTQPRMPYDSAAERSVLTAALCDPAQTDELLELAPPEDFYLPAHATMWRAVREMRVRREHVDYITLRTELDRTGKLQAVGGDEVMLEVAGEFVLVAHAREHARAVRDHARARRLIEAAQTVAAAGLRGGLGLDELVDLAETVLGACVNETMPGEPVSFGEIVTAEYSALQAQGAKGVEMQGFSYGIRKLDDLTDGVHRGDLTLIAGRPGSGKSALAEHVVLSIARTPASVLVSSLEMRRGDWARRALAGESGVLASNLRSARLDGRDWTRVAGAAGRLSTLRIWIDDTPEVSARRLRSIAGRMRREHDIVALVVDYMGLVEHTRDVDRYDLRIADTSRTCKLIARELDIAVIVLVQLNRELEKRPNKRPQLQDLRDSGALEQDADNVLAVYREALYNPTCEDPLAAEIGVLKQRAGATGVVHCRYRAEVTRFEDLDPCPPPQTDLFVQGGA